MIPAVLHIRIVSKSTLFQYKNSSDQYKNYQEDNVYFEPGPMYVLSLLKRIY